MYGTLKSEKVIKLRCPYCWKLNDALGVTRRNGVPYSICSHCQREFELSLYTEIEVDEFHYECSQCGIRVDDTPDNWIHMHIQQRKAVHCPRCHRELGPSLKG